MTSKNTNALANLTPTFDYKYFLGKIALLEAQKRDKIPDETILAWFQTFKSNNWTKEKFDKQFDKVLKSPSYGAVKIDEFLNEEIKYSPEDFGRQIERWKNDMIRKGEKLLGDKETKTKAEYLNLNDDYIKLAVSKRIQLEYYNERQDAMDEIINKAIQLAREIINNEENKNE